MNIEEIIMDENSLISDVIDRLEQVRCRVVYLVRDNKLVASVSDGDIRRYVIDGMKKKYASELANYNLDYLNVYEKSRIKELFDEREIYSIPIINYNREVVEIVFRNGNKVRKSSNIGIQVVIMAGGKGTRLYPYTKILPKALIPIEETPISERIIRQYLDFGCDKFFMVVNHKKSMIQAYFDGCGSDYNIEYIMEEKPLGTGGGLGLIDSNNIGECFFLTNCDTIIDADYEEIYKYHVDSGNTITIVAAACKYTIPYGVIKRKEDCFVEMEEKPSLNFLINTGMYLVNREVLKMVPERTISFPEIIDIVKNSGNNRIGIYSIEEEAFMDMGRIEELEKMTAKIGLK